MLRTLVMMLFVFAFSISVAQAGLDRQQRKMLYSQSKQLDKILTDIRQFGPLGARFQDREYRDLSGRINGVAGALANLPLQDRRVGHEMKRREDLQNTLDYINFTRRSAKATSRRQTRIVEIDRTR